MIRFECDYLEGALPEILRRLQETNDEQTPGYGEDAYCDAARAKIKAACAAPDADVHFLVGGTQTNTTVIAACLRPHQGVVAAVTGHIGVHGPGGRRGAAVSRAVRAAGLRAVPGLSQPAGTERPAFPSGCGSSWGPEGLRAAAKA